MLAGSPATTGRTTPRSSRRGGYAITDRLAERSGRGKPPWPSFEEVRIRELASGLGCPAVRIDSYDDMESTLAGLLPNLARRSGPVLLDIQVAADPAYGWSGWSAAPAAAGWGLEDC
ncbi:hypothetical protein [Streptomyces sp. NPDC056291]|uniref:hypothetical protein n=1 Tax=Streptomyces sp. NPDC056291 TaxID=3345772 RepID=UPI0035DFCD83